MAWWVRNCQFLFLLNMQVHLMSLGIIFIYIYIKQKILEQHKTTCVLNTSAKQKKRLLLCNSQCQLEEARNSCALVFFVVTYLFIDIFCIFSQLSLSQCDDCWSMPLSFLWELLHSFDQHLPSFPESLSLCIPILLFTITPTNLPGAGSRCNDL